MYKLTKKDTAQGIARIQIEPTTRIESISVTTMRYRSLSWAAMHLSMLIAIMVINEAMERSPEMKSNTTPKTQRGTLSSSRILIAKEGCAINPTPQVSKCEAAKKNFNWSQRAAVLRIAIRTKAFPRIAVTAKTRLMERWRYLQHQYRLWRKNHRFEEVADSRMYYS